MNVPAGNTIPHSEQVEGAVRIMDELLRRQIDGRLRTRDEALSTARRLAAAYFE